MVQGMLTPRRRDDHPSRPGVDVTSLPFHPLLATAYPVVFLFAVNISDQVTVGPLWRPLALSVAGGVVATVIGRMLTGDWRRGALLATLAAALFFTFGHAWFLVSETIQLRRYLIGAYVAVGLVAGWLIWRGGSWVVPLTRVLNIGFAVLLVFNTFEIGSSVARASEGASTSQPAAVELNGHERPDVYYIILDRYANAWTLENIYGYDNTPFLDALRDRGFYVAEEAWANYFKTAFSLTSSLDMGFLDGPALAAHAVVNHEFGPIQARLRDHLAGPMTFASLGYEYVHISNFWEPTKTNADADVTLNYGDGLEFQTALLETTALSLLSPAADDATTRTIYGPTLVRKFHTYEFQQLEASAARDGPTFVFAHFLLPHPPYVYRADGSNTTSDQSPVEQYVEQVQYTSKRVLEAIDTITSAPGGDEAVIILQADEGPFPKEFEDDQRNFSWLQATPEQVAQKFGILDAVRMPGVDAEAAGMHDRSTPVNNLRIVLNSYFDAGLPLLPDTTYLSPDYPNAYDFVPVERDEAGLPIMSGLEASEP
jgi:hypothetical protein